jgi:hypothetical protein
MTVPTSVELDSSKAEALRDRSFARRETDTIETTRKTTTDDVKTIDVDALFIQELEHHRDGDDKNHVIDESRRELRENDTQSNDETEEEKRKRRMVSNRESARRSRARKVSHLAELRDKCAALWSDRAQTAQNIAMMENLVQRVRHENLRLDVDAGRVARQILAKRVYEHAPSLKYPVNEEDAEREKRAASAKEKTPTRFLNEEEDEKAPADPKAQTFAVASAAAR